MVVEVALAEEEPDREAALDDRARDGPLVEDPAGREPGRVDLGQLALGQAGRLEQGQGLVEGLAGEVGDGHGAAAGAGEDLDDPGASGSSSPRPGPAGR